MKKDSESKIDSVSHRDTSSPSVSSGDVNAQLMNGSDNPQSPMGQKRSVRPSREGAPELPLNTPLRAK